MLPFTARELYALRTFRLSHSVHEDPPLTDDAADDDDDLDAGAIIKSLTKLNPKAQRAIDAIVESRLAADRRKRQGTVDPDVTRRLTEAETKLREKERKEAEAKGEYERVTNSLREEFTGKESTWKQEREQLLGTIKQDRVTNALIMAASNADAVDPSDIAGLLANRVQLDDDLNVVVLDANGNKWLKGGVPVTVNQLVAWHKQQKGHMYTVKGADEGDGEGSGSGGGNGDGDADGGTKNGVSAKDIADAQAKYDELHKAAASAPSDANISASVAARRKLEALQAKRNAKKSA